MEQLTIDLASVRHRFPALRREQAGRPVLFFDNPAGTQVPEETIAGFAHYLTWNNANTGGDFTTSRATDQLIEDARRAMADFLGASSPGEIVFGPSMTALAFQVSHALRSVIEPGDEIVTTRLEHDANVSPWLALQQCGAAIKWIDIHPEDGTLDLDSAESAIGDRTRLVAVGYASNVLGTINDVHRIIEMAHRRGAWAFVDAVHYGPHGPIDVQDIGCDFLVCSSYKFFGPHLGIMYARRALLDTLTPPHVRPAGEIGPDKWEPGTKSHESLSALLGTIRYLQSLDGENSKDRRSQLHAVMSRIKRYERSLSEQLIGGLQEIPGARIYGLTDPAAFDWRVPTASFLFEGHDPFEVARALADRGIFSWAGDHYAIEPLARLGLTATQRVGLVHYNTPDEIGRFLVSLRDLVPYRGY